MSWPIFKPPACEGCPCYPWQGFLSKPQRLGEYNVLLIGEALGETEAETGEPFAGRAGFVLDKLIRHAGLRRDGFGIANAVWCRPPDNKLSGMPYESAALWQCGQRHLFPFIRQTRPRVMVPMGAMALSALLGRKDIMDARGYMWDHPEGMVYPTIHPSYILRGNGNFGTVFIHDIQQAVELARDGWHPAPTQYLLDPTPADAMQWVQQYLDQLSRDSGTYLAYDIETPYKGEEAEEGALEREDDDAPDTILRISFSYRAHQALSILWGGAYLSAISRALSTAGPKVVWNDGFDSPRIRAAGIAINGPVHDGMVAWHVLESDLPKSLRFVSSMLLPHQPPWKHLNRERPAFYNATDSDVELQLLHIIFDKLREARMWDVYDRHILQFAPLVARLSARGMPIDARRRAEFADRLAIRLTEVAERMTAAVPAAARKVAHVYKGEHAPKGDFGDLLQHRPGHASLLVCQACGCRRPGKAHFRAFKRPTAKRPQNPCAAAGTRMQDVATIEWYRLRPFRPSKDQLLLYCSAQKIAPIRRRTPDGYKVTFDENAIRTLALRHPDDALWGIILEYREVDKIAGTYIGRPSNI